MRHPQEGKKPRPLDNKWTFGTINIQKGYTMIGSEPVHRIVATAFLGEAPSKIHVVDHIDINRQNNRPENLRWVIRLENIVLNEITRRKLELLCGCTIDEILSDLSILRNKNLTPQFEWMRAGTIGSTLPSADTRITTNPGDIVLYSSNQIVLFYDSNTWSYTKLGHINLSKSELTDLLGDEDVVITLNLK